MAEGDIQINLRSPQEGASLTSLDGLTIDSIGGTNATGFGVQLKSTIRRQLLQKRRMWRSWLMEMCIPFLFVLTLNWIASKSSRTEVPAANYVSPVTPVYIGAAVRAGLCYNLTSAHKDLRSLLLPCELFNYTQGYTCFPKSEFLPVEGLCIPNAGLEQFQFLALGLVNEEMDVEIPNFDEYVLLKWAATVLPISDSIFQSATATARQSGNVYVTPRDDAGSSFVAHMNSSYVLFKHVFGGYFDTRDDAVPFATAVGNEGKVWAVVSMNQADTNGLDYVLSMNRTAQEITGSRNKFINGLGRRTYAKYLASGALTIQKAVNDFYLTKILKTTIFDTHPVGILSHMVLAPMPVASYTREEFLTVAGMIAPLVLVLAFLYPVSQLAKRLVEEKEQRLREGTMIMGLSKAAFFASWLIVYYVQMAVISIGLAAFVKYGIAKQSDFFVIWVPYLFFSITTVNMAALLSTLFSKAKIAALCVPLLFFIFAIPAFAIPSTTSPIVFYFVSVLCPVPFSMALKLVFSYEINSGLGWNSALSSSDEPYNMATALAIFVVDYFLYIGLMIYLDLILPKEYGTTKHPLFFIKYFREKISVHSASRITTPSSTQKFDNPKNHFAKKVGRLHAIQDYPLPNDHSSVYISELRKEFKGAGGLRNVAVDGMELRMFRDGITVFLGHNGAGKTTVMNMMTGMMSPTDGDIIIYGKSVLTDMPSIRRDIGFCPQHNILWDDLTCMEHLQYFARLKGMHGAAVDEEAIDMLTKVDLLEKKNVLSANLSGGQKRKLSVAIAFMGKARLVLLDEPTAGMDVAARRHTWDVLKDMSKGRTILLSTHFMDEADLLGSRIAIMSKGSLHSYGTPMYLKNQLGSGYVMRIASPSMITDPLPILEEVRRIVPSAHIREAKGQELSISLPKDEARHFPQVIRTMDSEVARAKLKYSTVSLSVASLEDVFLAIAHQEGMDLDDEEMANMDPAFLSAGEAKVADAFKTLELAYSRMHPKQSRVSQGNRVPLTTAIDISSSGSSSPSPSSPITKANASDLVVGNCGSFGRQLKGMLMKRLHHGHRDYCALAIQIIAPILCIVLALGLSTISSSPGKTFYDNKLYGSVGQMLTANNCTDAEWDPDFVTIDNQDVNSSFSFSEYLLETYSEHGSLERMVSFSCNDDFGNTVLFANASGTFTAPQALHQYYRNLVRRATNGEATITTAQWPLPYTERQQTTYDAIASLFVALFVLIPFTFIPSTFVSFVVRERECKSKHLQFVSGANYTAYWLGNFLFDLSSYLITVGIAFALFAYFDQDWAVGSVSGGLGTFTLFLLYGLSGIGFAYLVSFLFEVHSTAQTVIMMLNFISGFLLVILMYFFRNIDSMKDFAEYAVIVLRAVPTFALGDGLFQMLTANALAPLVGRKSPFDTDIAGQGMFYMAVFSAVFLAATMFIDHPSRQRRRELLSFKSTAEAPAISNEDEDVALERKEIESGRRSTDVVQVQGLRKEFDMGGGEKKVAVSNITFGVKPGEVFGFLGTNGAGKTTTMSMLTTEILPSCGHGRIGGYDIVQRSDMTRRLIGYCPQFDAIMDLLTPTEHLKLFAALRGIPVAETKEVISALITSCALAKYRDIPAGKLSGGNKRKLSVAMALIGGPSIVFLDEPSAGMDPHARRLLWDVIIFVAKRSSVVLTTHHLEEVDVLAHRVGIMDNGLMKCLGSLEHLKRKFGSGFELTLQVADDGQERATAFIMSKYPTAVLVESRQQRILYTLPFETTDLASLFETIQKATDDPAIGITDYTVQQTSLEQVFMRITELGEDSVVASPTSRQSSTMRRGFGIALNEDSRAASEHFSLDDCISRTSVRNK